jgi:hypothetical protein
MLLHFVAGLAAVTFWLYSLLWRSRWKLKLNFAAYNIEGCHNQTNSNKIMQ